MAINFFRHFRHNGEKFGTIDGKNGKNGEKKWQKLRKDAHHFRRHGKNGEKIGGENGENQWLKWRIFFAMAKWLKSRKKINDK